MRRALCAVALLALACLLVRAARVGLAGDYIDPISKITAQDEALYSHSAISMAREGDWLTPHFMGRFALYKPPLLIWAAALSTKALGVSRIPLRLPGVILSALALGLLFLWGAELAGWQAGLIAALLVLSNHLWFTLATLCMTDAFLVSFYVAALYALFCDPWLESRAALWGFSGSVAAAILTKGIAGVLPLGVLGVFWLAVRRKEKPSFLRVCLAAGLAVGLASPWFIYELIAHYRWFWTEHVAVEILGYGTGTPPQTSREHQAAFYFMRLAATDPLLLACFFSAVPGFLTDLRRRTAEATLAGAWALVMVAAVLGWQYRNASYLLPLIPVLALLTAGWSPFATARYGRWMIVALAAGFLIKASQPSLAWGLNAQDGTVQPASPSLSKYCEQGRGNPLIVVGFADDLYATTLPLERLRYATLVPVVEPPGPYEMPFTDMGISVTVPQFADLAREKPVFRARLAKWGVSSDAPIATLIAARSTAELGELAAAHPDSDFLFPAEYRDVLQSAPQVRWNATSRYIFLLARNRLPRSQALAWTCRM